MAVETTVTEASFTGTGVSSTYGTGFYINASDQVKVYVNGILKTLGDDYVLNNVGSQAGADVVATFTAGALVFIQRSTPITQLVDTQNNETILEDVLDAEFDKLTMIAQEINTKADNALAAIAAGGLTDAFIVRAVASEALAKNDFVNVFYTGGANQVRKANGAVEARYATGFVVAAANPGDTISVVLIGINPVTTVLNGEVWLSDAIPGAFTTNPPSTSGSTLQSLGIAMPGAGVFFSPKGRVIL